MTHERVDLMAERVAQGLDIWSGKPLEGHDADNWLRIQDQVEEVEPELTPEESEKVVKAIKTLAWSTVLLRKQYGAKQGVKSVNQALGDPDTAGLREISEQAEECDEELGIDISLLTNKCPPRNSSRRRNKGGAGDGTVRSIYVLGE